MPPAPNESAAPRAIDRLVVGGTALLFVVRPGGPWWVRVGLVLMGALALLGPRRLERPWLWWSFAGLLGARLVADWPLPDNHLYLEAYWALAIALALGAARPAAVLRASARWLLGGAFAFAVLWKAVLSPDYRDGRFFRVTLLQDTRMTHALRLAGLDEATIVANRQALEPWPAGVEPIDPPRVVEPPALRGLASFLTWCGGIGLEAAIAVAFLAPLSGGAALARPTLLLAFCAGAYALAPVAGFAWLLLAMSLAALPEDASRRWRPAHGAVAALVLLWAELPWSKVLGFALASPPPVFPLESELHVRRPIP
jgi:hypothetical protein